MSKEGVAKVVVRFPPSPTGLPHIGNIRTFLFNFLFARQNNGAIYLRFEDTDRERSKREHETDIMYALEKLGIGYDYGPYRQSERGVRYEEAIEKLIRGGHAYEAEMSEDGSGERVIRFRNPNRPVTFTDVVRGEITIDTTDFGDFVIARSKTNPLYHLTVVVDDIDMAVTHVIRGADHITSTPRQILLFEALESEVPSFAHLPMILGEDGKKLSKRHGAISYQEFERLGYLPEAIVNYLALVGWNPGNGNNQEFFSMTDLIHTFSLSGLQQSPAKFSYEKLDSVNRHYIQLLSDDAFTEMVGKWVPQEVQTYLEARGDATKRVLYGLLRERISKWSDVSHAFASELSWLIAIGEYEPALLVWKKGTVESTRIHMTETLARLEAVSQWEGESIKAGMWEYAESVGRGDVLWPLRTALTGLERSPDPFIVAEILGKEETLVRLRKGLEKLVV